MRSFKRRSSFTGCPGRTAANRIGAFLGRWNPAIKLAVNAALNTAKTVLGLLFPLITYPYVSRVLGVDNLGIYTFSVSIVSYFQLLAALGVTPYGIREGTQYRNDKEKIEEEKYN